MPGKFEESPESRRQRRQQAAKRRKKQQQIQTVILIAVILAVILIAGLIIKGCSGGSDETTPSQTSPPVTTTPETTAPQPSDTNPPETTAPVPTETEPPATLPPAPDSGTPESDFSLNAVDESTWYDDVLFIGDSRTVGQRDYHRSGNAEYFCSVGMSVFSCMKTACADLNFSSQTLVSLLQSKQYGKVFISLGINECGYPTANLIKAYQELIDTVRQYQPDAIIIMQGIMTVSQNYASGKNHFSPSHIFSINEEIAKLADNETIYYIDVNKFFTDDQGYLLSYVSSDGCHLTAQYVAVWADWISYAVGNLGL